MNRISTNNRLRFGLKTGALLGLCLALSGVNQLHAQCAGTTGVKSVGPSGDYPSLTSALANLKTGGFTGSVVLELQTTYTSASETFPITIPAMGCMTTGNTVTIRPAETVTSPILIASAASQAFVIDSAKNIIIDGRAGGIGTSAMLTIVDSNTLGNAIKFVNGANNNVIKYCMLKGRSTSTTSGVIDFSTSANNPMGNSYNTVSNCDITGTGDGTENPIVIANYPAACITSSGATIANPNRNNVISNNNIYNFINGTVTTARYGINFFTAGNNRLTISGNSIYQTAANPAASGSSAGTIVYGINTAIGDSTTIKNNYIGGNAPNATGVWVSNPATTANNQRVIAIQIAGNINIASNVDGNIIRGFDYQTISTTAAIGVYFAGIMVPTGAPAGTLINIGVNEGNTIGSMTATDAIKVTSNGAGGSPTAAITAINVSCPVTNTVIKIQNNNIGGITGLGLAATNATSIHAIYISQPVNRTIKNNTIGGAIANSISTGTDNVTTALPYLSGIYNGATPNPSLIQNNTIRNMTVYGASSAAPGTNFSGIYSAVTGNTATTVDSITGNHIYNLSNLMNDGPRGIRVDSKFAAILYNNIHDLSQRTSITSSGNLGMNGINTAAAPASGNVTIAYNTVQRLIRLSNAITNGSTVGLNLNTTAATTLNVYNNTVVLDSAGTSITLGSSGIYGAKLPGSTTALNFHNNIIKVNAIPTGTSGAGGAAVLWGTSYSATAFPGAAAFNSNNNIYSINKRDSNFVFCTGTSQTLPDTAFSNCDTCTMLTGKTVFDANFNTDCSLYKRYMKVSGNRENASFIEDVSITGGLTYPNNLQPNPADFTYVLNRGKSGLGFTSDILGNAVSSTTPDIGAMEFATGYTDLNAGSPLINNIGAANTATANATASVKFYNNDCELMAQVTPSGSAQVSGNVTAQAWLDNVQNNFVKRHLQLTPAINPTTATATVTLYYTQSDFDDFNAGNPTALQLPSSPSGGTGNVRIQKFSGSSNNGLGNPASYTGAQTTIVPSSVTWSADSLWWAVTFDVTGFSGFFLNTDPNTTPLAVNWISTTAALNKQQQAVIDWVVSEKEVAAYDVQKSNDGSSFKTIATVKSKGDGTNNYSITEAETLNGKAWYRIAQQNVSGNVDYSSVMMLNNNVSGNHISIYPNPATQVLNIEVAETNSTYSIFDLQGKMVQKGTLSQGKNAININNLTKGFYMIKVGSYTQKVALQ